MGHFLNVVPGPFSSVSYIASEQVSDIKDALNLFGDDRQSHRAAGDFLYLTAKQKGDLDSREQIKAKREVENVVDGHYDYQQKRGFSVRR